LKNLTHNIRVSGYYRQVPYCFAGHSLPEGERVGDYAALATGEAFANQAVCIEVACFQNLVAGDQPVSDAIEWIARRDDGLLIFLEDT
jgi:hypothetical protein